jgi:hypothetical protein
MVPNPPSVKFNPSADQRCYLLNKIFYECITANESETGLILPIYTTVFFHTLVGGVHHWQSGSAYTPATFESSGFAMAYGGGLDVKASERIAIRVVQFDWIPIREKGSWVTNTMRFGFGIVFRAAK